MDDQPLLTELLEIGRRGWQSLCDGSGDAFFGEISFDLDDVRLVRTGTDGATLVYIGSAVLDPVHVTR